MFCVNSQHLLVLYSGISLWTKRHIGFIWSNDHLLQRTAVFEKNGRLVNDCLKHANERRHRKSISRMTIASFSAIWTLCRERSRSSYRAHSRPHTSISTSRCISLKRVFFAYPTVISPIYLRSTWCVLRIPHNTRTQHTQHSHIHTKTQTHTHAYISIYIAIVCV